MIKHVVSALSEFVKSGAQIAEAVSKLFQFFGVT
jgi:hypothetical protein